MEVVDILVQAANQRNGRLALQLDDLLDNTFFIVKVSKRYIVSLAGCDNVTTRNTNELTNDDGGRRLMVRGGISKKDSWGTTYMRDVTEELPKQVKICGNDNSFFRLERGNALSRASSTSISK